MEILQMIDWNALFPYLGVVIGLCAAGVVLLLVLQVLGTGLALFASLLEIGLELLAGGPFVWCGCFVLIGMLCMCGLIFSAIATGLQTCDTDSPLILCRFFR